MTFQPNPSARLQTLDAVRGFAVMGILLMNIVSFGMPDFAYVDPSYYGGTTGADGWAWWLAYIFADGKMRGLFTMMFGASTVLIAERALASGESPARTHYARMFWLFVIGMIHAWLIWYGDILVSYAICGAVMFLAWRWRPRTLFAFAAALLVYKLAVGLMGYSGLAEEQRVAASPNATIEQKADAARTLAAMSPEPGGVERELEAYRGGYAENLPARARMTWFFQVELFWDGVPDTLALIALGMALFKVGFFNGEWSHRAYWTTAVAGLAISIPFYVPLAAWRIASDYSMIVYVATEAIHLTLLRPPMALAYASLVILFIQSKLARGLADRLAAAGRMAFSNYLGTSLVATTFFYGFGFGWFGYLGRAELWLVVLAIWALLLIWSKPWLDRYRYGPFEWLWRSLSRGRPQPMRR